MVMSESLLHKATPVEGDFGGDFVRRNRSQLNRSSRLVHDSQ